MKEALQVVKFVLVNEPSKSDGYCKKGRLYFHDDVRSEAILLADDLKIYELRSAEVHESLAFFDEEALEMHFDNQRVSDPKFHDVDFAGLVERFLDSDRGAKFLKSRKYDSDSALVDAVRQIAKQHDINFAR